MTPTNRENIIKKLQQPSPHADMLIEAHLDHPSGDDGCQPYTQVVEAALQLVPENQHILCGRFQEGKLFWCDVGFRPQVQAWGENMASAIAGAAFAYHTYPEVND